MSFFGKIKDFNHSRKEKKIEKNIKIIKNAKAIRDDRLAALNFFKYLDDPQIATQALLQRFEYSLEHGINDSREKELALEGIVRHKEDVVPTVKEHLKQTNKIAWPIKILNKVSSEEVVAETLRGALNYGDVSFDQHIVDKNYDVLCYLADYQIEGLADQVKHFLNDPDERVRFATVEVLVRQNDDGIQNLLEDFLLDSSAENRRIRMTVIEAYIAKGWAVSNPKDYSEGPLVEGVFVTKSGKLERRN